MSSAPSSLFRLNDLLQQHDLGLQLLVGGPDAGQRRVSGVHTIEIPRPARWLAPDWVMLTTGMRLTGQPDAQRALPEELAAAGVTALGFALEQEFRAVPEPLLQAARARDFPVFAVPLSTPFREIQAFVQRALLSSEMRVLQRLSSMQRYLVDALYAPDPQATVVERLSTLLEGSVAIVAPDGAVEATTGELPRGLGRALHDPAPGVREPPLPGWRVVAAPIAPDADDPDGRWLVLAVRGDQPPHRLTRPVLHAAAPLLAAVGRLEQAVRHRDHAARRVLLEELIAGDGDPRLAHERAAAFGIDLQEPTAIVVVAGRRGPWTAAQRERVERRLRARLTTRGVAALATVDHHRIALLLGVSDAGISDDLLAALAEAGDVRLGVGRHGRGPANVRLSALDAHVAVVRAADDEVRWRRYAELDLPALAVGELAADRVAPLIGPVLQAIDARPGLREALNAYFAHDLDVTAAAAALHLHPNSLRYRLGRLTEALGRPLRDPTTIATLVLALEFERRAPHEPGTGTADGP